ncbi:esterase-like activity of phytase family protein [Siccirubricoccus sp. KC 17139]|uniref:Esterase-like activity of phytase family protein n=1 Tax=Siccirubricoccus soli TaxID=2899147 RepID=A0ABT1D6P1_9PROT|nr:esterase-like activity of phytase family protein [Siccirubricoccus soli]MCO6416670.1 esterase-like activity of phytase family protein [Siccirubricoccus soli]MCP2682805.1 esterase-like activity of phytase family protein [Siccirubricoccus soli]
MRTILLAAGLLAAVAGTARADQRFEATLAGHAILPAGSFTPPPADAPPGFATSGRFTGPGNLRVEQRGAIPGDTGATHGRRPTGLSLPFEGQPIQGFSGIKPVAGEPGAYWVLTDNGFGNRRNSADVLLMFHKVRPDFRAGTVTVERTIFLSDPNRVLPFPIVTEATPTRYLTGADLDLESLQPVADGFWIGEEFGPFLIKVDQQGRVQRLVATKLGEEEIRSPDNPALQLPASPTGTVAFRSQRSGGYEGMAQSPDGSRLYALLEKPLFRADGQAEGNFLRILEFDTARGAWTGRTMKYRFEQGGVSIGDFNMLDDRRALIIERDDGEGDPSLACGEGKTPPACFPMPARLKRIYLVDLQDTDSEGFVRKIGHIDLMAIRDPEGLSRGNGDRAAVPNDRFTFPFFTIENVAVVDADHIIVANDNNLPFSAGRRLTAADNNEFILLRVPELLRAR